MAATLRMLPLPLVATLAVMAAAAKGMQPLRLKATAVLRFSLARALQMQMRRALAWQAPQGACSLTSVAVRVACPCPASHRATASRKR